MTRVWRAFQRRRWDGDDTRQGSGRQWSNTTAKAVVSREKLATKKRRCRRVPGTITKPAPTGVSAHIRLPSQPQTYPQILRTGQIKSLTRTLPEVYGTTTYTCYPRRERGVQRLPRILTSAGGCSNAASERQGRVERARNRRSSRQLWAVRLDFQMAFK